MTQFDANFVAAFFLLICGSLAVSAIYFYFTDKED